MKMILLIWVTEWGWYFWSEAQNEGDTSNLSNLWFFSSWHLPGQFPCVCLQHFVDCFGLAVFVMQFFSSIKNFELAVFVMEFLFGFEVQPYSSSGQALWILNESCICDSLHCSILYGLHDWLGSISGNCIFVMAIQDEISTLSWRVNQTIDSDSWPDELFHPNNYDHHRWVASRY